MILVPVSYAATLAWLGPKFISQPNAFDGFKLVILNLGLFSTLLCAVAAFFSWKK